MTVHSVGRDALRSPEVSPRSSPDPELTELLRSRIQSDFTFKTLNDDVDEILRDAGESDEEAELVLFAGPLNTKESHRIRLSSPDASAGEPGLLVKKPRSYFFADDLNGEKEKEYMAAAVTGDQVIEMSKIPRPGCTLPWKVCSLTSGGMKKIVLVGHPPVFLELEEQARKRTRKSKKARIALRQKMQAAGFKQAEQARLAQEKEEAEREKRTRRNREKKVKRKARDKAKKEEASDPKEPTPTSPKSGA